MKRRALISVSDKAGVVERARALVRELAAFYAIAALTALFVCALIAAGCGDDDDETTTTTSVGENAQQTVDEAVNPLDFGDNYF